MTWKLNGLTGKCKVIHIIGSPQQFLVVPYSRRRCTKDRIFDPEQAIQMDYNANGADECARNVHANDEQLVNGYARQRSSGLPR